MRETRDSMGMPITVEVVDPTVHKEDLEDVFTYFKSIDERFSTYKNTSEISRINRGEIGPEEYSDQMKEVIMLSEKTKQESSGFFDIKKADGTLDPSGLVKGWAIQNAAQQLLAKGYKHFFIDAGGDIQSHGTNAEGKEWSVGIRNPFNQKEIIKVLYPKACGIATSGTYIRGQHIYNPHQRGAPLTEIVSITVVGPNVYEADRFATAAFAMGKKGIHFIERLQGFEGYMIDKNGTATMTTGFTEHTII